MPFLLHCMLLLAWHINLNLAGNIVMLSNLLTLCLDDNIGTTDTSRDSSTF